MIKEIFSRLRAFRWQKLLIIWAVFVAMAAILFAERSGIQYDATKFQINYLPRTEVKPAQIAMFGQPVTCLLLYDSGQEGTDLAKKAVRSNPTGYENKHAGCGCAHNVSYGYPGV